MLKKKCAPQVRGAEQGVSHFLAEKGCSVDALAKALNVECRIVSEWCMGSEIPNAIQVIEITKVLNCHPKEVYLAIFDTPIPFCDAD